MKLIDTAMSAAYLRCSVRHVRHLIERGILHNHGDERRALISLDALSDAVQTGQVKPQPARGRPAK